jgi:hypothetical protein
MPLTTAPTPILALTGKHWQQSYSINEQQRAIATLEQGGVLFLPDLPFALLPEERAFLSPDTVDKSKNVNFDINTGRLRGTALQAAAFDGLKSMVERFAQQSRQLVQQLLPHYSATLAQARTSYRPVEIKGRPSSWRKDDTRLHVDAFPSSPVRDKRILRVFSNINPDGKPRAWRLGEEFEAIARRYLPAIKPPLPGAASLLQFLHVTKSRRSDYDHYMLHLHDSMKADLPYQANSRQMAMDFPPGSSWVVYSDQVSHAAMGGQYLMEQTFYLPVAGMQDPARSPLRTLERLIGRTLV